MTFLTGMMIDDSDNDDNDGKGIDDRTVYLWLSAARCEYDCDDPADDSGDVFIDNDNDDRDNVGEDSEKY